MKQRIIITPKTPLGDLVKAHPWLLSELPKRDSRLKKINSPIGRLVIKKMTVEALAKKIGQKPEDVISYISKVIEDYGNTHSTP